MRRGIAVQIEMQPVEQEQVALDPAEWPEKSPSRTSSQSHSITHF